MFGTFKLIFDVDILTYFGYFLKIWEIFFISSSHSGYIFKDSLPFFYFK